MNLLGWQTWILGVRGMILHPLRSGLTVLGIFIGVASVIWLLAIGEGISNKAQEQIASLGADNIIVRSIKTTENSQGSGFSVANYGLTRKDYFRLVSTIPTIRRAVPIRELRRRFSYGDSKPIEGRLVGSTPDYADLAYLQMERGRFISASDMEEKQNHCVLSSSVAEKLFQFENPLGRAVLIEDQYYVVVGVTRPRNPSAGIGGSLAAEDFAADIYVPISTVWQRIGDMVMTGRTGSFEIELVELNQITLSVKDVSQVMQTADIVRETLAAHHKLQDYGVVVPLELLEQARTTRLMFILLLGLIAAISLVVGGIGIMNIMLATVTERTREIGIRRALGAKRNDITRQFLAETVVLSVVGGATGILGGLTCGPFTRWIRYGVEYAFPEAMATLPDLVRSVTPDIVPWSIPLAFGISVGVGILFGLYPAVRAAHLDPIEALRHE
jgi:putative ABC transport system permease protein